MHSLCLFLTYLHPTHLMPTYLPVHNAILQINNKQSIWQILFKFSMLILQNV